MPSKGKSIERLEERKRVDITPKNYLSRCQRVFIIEILLTALAAGGVLYFFGVTFLTVGISGIMVLVCTAACLYVRKNTKAVAVKGDSLILNSFDNRSLVTSLRSIRSIKTKHFLLFHFTSLEFNLDGLNRTTIVINRPWAVEHKPEEMVKLAIALSKENREKKANHKLGSVAV